MNTSDLERFRGILEEKRTSLTRHIQELEKTPDMGDDVDSLEEEADETRELGNQMSVSQEYREQLAEVEEALRRFEKGTYGSCTQCGGAIEMAILEIDPESALCQSCKQKERA